MSVRYRWYRIRLPRKDLDLRRLLLGNPMREGSTFGFRRMDGTSEADTFRFLWRVSVVLTRFSEDYEPTYERLESWNFVDLSIVRLSRTQFLRIENHGRNLRDLMNALESIVGLGFSCLPVIFDTVTPDDFSEGVDEARLVGFKVVGVVGEDLVARMEFASKNGIDLKAMSLLKGVRYKVDAAVFECSYRGLRGQVSIAAGGTVRLAGQLTPRLIHLIEKKLPSLTNKSHAESE